jgi:hypothetical protein
MYAKIDRWNYKQLGEPVIDRGRPGKALYAVKGICPPDFRMLRITAIRYIGDMEEDNEK